MKYLVPKSIRFRVREWLNNRRRQRQAPRMLWGYRGNDGEWLSNVRISDTAFLYHPERIDFADDVFVWHYTILDGTGGLTIGTGTQIGAWVGIFTHSSHLAIRLYGAHYHEVPEAEKQAYPKAPVSIGRYVFIGAGAKVLPGVTIGDGALISTGAVISKDVPPFTIMAGNPAKPIGDTRKLRKKV